MAQEYYRTDMKEELASHYLGEDISHPWEGVQVTCKSSE